MLEDQPVKRYPSPKEIRQSIRYETMKVHRGVFFGIADDILGPIDLVPHIAAIDFFDKSDEIDILDWKIPLKRARFERIITNYKPRFDSGEITSRPGMHYDTRLQTRITYEDEEGYRQIYFAIDERIDKYPNAFKNPYRRNSTIGTNRQGEEVKVEDIDDAIALASFFPRQDEE